MFTGIVQAVATLHRVTDHQGIRSFEIAFPDGFCRDIEIGASVAIDGVCLTVTEIVSTHILRFDVMLKSLQITTLNEVQATDTVNAERAAKDGAEIGGHPLSGHVDFCAQVIDVQHIEENYRIRIGVEPQWLRYIFPKGYIAINGASLTIADVDKKLGWFDVWLIPETRRMTTFELKQPGSKLNIEIERSTQVLVDTVRETLEENLGELLPALESLLEKNGISLQQLAKAKMDIN
ncbi:riboflavin synthase subunit alpha [Vibrio rumoiensis]|uniref:Riboflavin synthase n=1 Tax=Vibrio rumoiensis TaxID=76258 RepID=A0ABW7IZ82_9VIBR